MKKQNIKQLSQKQLEEIFIENGDKAFRGRQVYDWLWKKNAASFDDMSDLSKDTRNFLKKYFILSTIVSYEKHKSTDGTIKLLFTLDDGALIEGVLIPAKGRMTACISSQAGCPLKCKFCATGMTGFTRDLVASEIVEQVTIINAIALETYKRPLSNIVLMGMGEPLLNYDEVMSALKIITSDEALGMSPRRITLSTVGIVPGIRRLADHGIKINLAISLHTVIDAKRTMLMPINTKYSLKELSQAIQYYHKTTGQRITYEYILLNRINDSPEDARALTEFCKISPCKINLIPYNGIGKSEYMCSEQTRIDEFKEALDRCNLVVQVRRSKGADIMAACGQLATKK